MLSSSLELLCTYIPIKVVKVLLQRNQWQHEGLESFILQMVTEGCSEKSIL